MSQGISLGLADARYSQPLPERLKGASLSKRAVTFLNPTVITTPPAWAINTAYLTGAVVSISGNMYQCVIAGTSAGSGGPTGTSLTTSVVDNTVTWMPLGPTNPTASTTDCPTQTPWNVTVTGITNPVLQKVSTGTLNSSKFNIRNCGYAVLDKNQNLIGVNSTYAVGTANGNINGAVPGISQYNVRYEFITDAISWSPSITAQCQGKVFINDDPLEVGGTQIGNASTGANGTTFTFPTKISRKIAIELPQGIALSGIYIGQSDTMSAPNDPYPVRALFIMDSYGSGGQGFPLVAGRYCGTLAGHALGWPDTNTAGVGSTGISALGANSQGNFITRVPTDVLGGYLTIPTVTGTVTTAIQTLGVIAVTCPALSHAPFVGQQVTLAGMTPASLNGTFQVTLGTSPSTTAFSLTNPVSVASPVTATVEGTIALNYTNYNTFMNTPWKPYDVVTAVISVNDSSTAAATEAANAVALYQAIRAGNPTCIICFVGIAGSPSVTNSIGLGTPVGGTFLGAVATTAGYIEAYVFQQLQAAAAAAHDTHLFCMPFTAITDSSGLNSVSSIFTGIGFTGFGSPAGSPSDVVGNTARLYAWAASANAAAHPTELGAKQWALSYANWFRSSVLPNLN